MNPQLRDLLSQPSWSTEVITGIISQTEMCIGRMQAHFQSMRQASDRQSDQVQSNLGILQAIEARQQPDNQAAAPPQNAAAPMDVAEGQPDSQQLYRHHSSSSLSIENEVVMKTIVSITSGEDSHDSGVEDQDDEMPQAPANEVASAPPLPLGSGDNSAAANGNETNPNPVPQAHSSGPSGIEHLVNIPLLQQMHVALRTWDYLYDHASTPSTVITGAGKAPTPPTEVP